MTLASALKDTIRRVSAREIQKIMRRVRRLQRQVKALRQEGRAQRRIIAGRGAALHAPEGARATYRRVRRPRPTAYAAVDPLAPRAIADAADRVRQTRRREPRIHLRVGDRPHVAPRPQRGSATRSAEDGPPQGTQRSRLRPPSRKGSEASTPLTQLSAFRSEYVGGWRRHGPTAPARRRSARRGVTVPRCNPGAPPPRWIQRKS